MSFTPGSLMVHLSVASFLGLAVVSGLVGLLAIRNPACRALLFAWVLIAPVLAFSVHSVAPRECSVLPGISYWAHLACVAGRWLGLAGLAIMGAGLLVVLAQTGATLIMCHRLVSTSTPAGKVPGGGDAGGVASGGSGSVSSSAAQPAVAALAEICAGAGVERPRLLLTRLNGVCCTIGVFRPSVVLSRDLCGALEPDELRAVLAHEVAHITRHDNALGLVAGVLRALTFFSPAAHYALSRYLVEREKAADDLAVALSGDAVALASGLLKVYRARETRLQPKVLVEVAATGEGLKGRIRRLLAPDENAARGPVRLQTWRASAVAVLVLVLTLYLC
ncbi:MAG: M56 family metallopeptidase [Firmicutes bacterium]|nr:M56 family metallopeptidase [Bacillota bacterium]